MSKRKMTAEYLKEVVKKSFNNVDIGYGGKMCVLPFQSLVDTVDLYEDKLALQEVEIQQLTEEKAELQKQVDELKKRLIDKVEAFIVEAYGKVKRQAEKDTAKKCNDFIHALICKYNGYIDRKDGAYGNMHKEADEFAKEKFGVEVE